MKRLTLKKQQGAVLAFSLVMLLLLTLVSISMIRQNKVQINVANNAGQQVKAFAAVETALNTVGDTLVIKRMDMNGDGAVSAVEKDGHHCRAGAIHPAPHASGILTGAVGLSSDVAAKVMSVHCLSNYDAVTRTGNELQCRYVNNTSTRYDKDTDVGAITAGSVTPYVRAVPSQDEVNACKKLVLSEAVPTTTTGAIPKPGACGIEVYTLNVELTDAATLAKRTVESKFLIDCTNDLNPNP